MSSYPNLISDSLLVNETIELLKLNQGMASAVTIVDRVMNIDSAPPELAKVLVSDIIAGDPRFILNDEVLELIDTKGFDRKLNDTEFVIFDLETTGSNAPPCRITEIGAYKVSGRKIIDEYQTLVNPETPIPAFITGLTNITDSMVKDAPKFAELAEEFIEFIGNSILVAHNAVFDMRFLNYEIGLVYPNSRVANSNLCTVKMSRKLIQGIENHKLATVANYYSIDLTNHHRAAADAFATAKIFINFLELLEEKEIYDLKGVNELIKRRKR